MTRIQDLTRQVALSVSLAGAMASSVVLAATPPASADNTTAQYKRWIVEMKEQPRGPFTPPGA